MALWRIADARLPAPGFAPWVVRLMVFFTGLLATGLAAGAVWRYDPPDIIVTTRIVADGGDEPAARSVLAAAAQPWLLAPGHPGLLEDAGRTLVLSAREPDFAAAARRTQSMADAVLNHPAEPAVSPVFARPTDRRGEWLADRTRLAAAMDAAQAQSVATSVALTAVVRDLAGGRAEAGRMTNRDTLDKGASMLADLQLQRLEMLGKYRADFPGIAELDDRIQTLRAFLADEQRRVDAAMARPAHVDPALAAEQDRLHGEQSQLQDREALLSVQLGHVEQSLAAIFPAAIPSAAIVVPGTILVQGATISAVAENARAVIVPAIAAIGLAFAALAAVLLPKRRPVPVLPPYSIVLQPTQAALQHWAAHAQPALPDAGIVQMNVASDAVRGRAG